MFTAHSSKRGQGLENWRPYSEGNPEQRVEYYYFDGDTIIDEGKTCKQMMCQRYISSEYPDYANLSQLPSLSTYVGAWYEEDKKVYFYDRR